MALQPIYASIGGGPCSTTPPVLAYPVGSLFIQRGSVRLKIASLRHSYPRDPRLSSSTCFSRSRITFPVKRRPDRLQATSLQAFMADGDASSSDEVGSSEHALKLSTAWSVQVQEGVKPFFESSLHALNDGVKNLRERGLLQSSKEGFEDVYSRLKTVDGKSVVKNVSQSTAVTQGARVWHAGEPWIKWPLAIFALLYVAVFATCGAVVAQDLVPFWIIGPVVTGLIIKSVYQGASLVQQFATRTEPLRTSTLMSTSQLYADARNGELIDKMRRGIELKNKEMKEDVLKKRADLTLYVKSGQAATDFKLFMMLKFSQFSEWSLDKYEDFNEWIRPFWRAFSRLMKKLF